MGAALAVLLGAAAPPPVPAATVEARLEQRDGSPLADAVVAAYRLDAAETAPPGEAVMDQRDRKFVPRVLAVQRGARVRFSNSDTVSHHVYSFSPTKRFQLFLEKGAPPPAVEFERAGVVTLGCNLHDWMLGYVVVVDTPHFGKSGADGALRLERLPAGRWRLELWHPRATDDAARLRQEVELGPRDVRPWTVRLERPLVPSREQEPAFGEYGGR